MSTVSAAAGRTNPGSVSAAAPAIRCLRVRSFMTCVLRLQMCSSSLEHANKLGLLLIMLPGLGNAIGIAREAHLQQFHLFRRDREKLAEGARVHCAARVLLHFKAVEKHLGNAAGSDDA